VDSQGLCHLLAGETGKASLYWRSAWRLLLAGDPCPMAHRLQGNRARSYGVRRRQREALNLERARLWRLPMERIRTPFDDPFVDVKIDNAAHRHAIEMVARQDDVRFIVVDSLSGASTRDENSSDTLGLVIWLAELARDTGKAVLLLHHLRKRGILDGDQR